MKEPTTTFKQQQMHFKGLISKQFQNIFVEYNKKSNEIDSKIFALLLITEQICKVLLTF